MPGMSVMPGVSGMPGLLRVAGVSFVAGVADLGLVFDIRDVPDLLEGIGTPGVPAVSRVLAVRIVGRSGVRRVVRCWMVRRMVCLVIGQAVTLVMGVAGVLLGEGICPMVVFHVSNIPAGGIKSSSPEHMRDEALACIPVECIR